MILIIILRVRKTAAAARRGAVSRRATLNLSHDLPMQRMGHPPNS